MRRLRSCALCFGTWSSLRFCSLLRFAADRQHVAVDANAEVLRPHAWQIGAQASSPSSLCRSMRGAFIVMLPLPPERALPPLRRRRRRDRSRAAAERADRPATGSIPTRE